MENTTAATEISMTILQWINVISLGALCGAIGQGARTIVSLKKLSDTAQEQSVSVSELIQVSRMVLAFMIGAVAGALAAITMLDPDVETSLEQILGLIGAGYIGADFIEGFISRINPADQKPRTETVGDSAPSPSPSPASDGAIG